MGGFFNSILQCHTDMKEKLLKLDEEARKTGLKINVKKTKSLRLNHTSSIAGNWSGYNLCDIVTKARRVAFVVSTDPDVRFKCCISADSKVQASIKHETKVKRIQACRVHSRALDELTSQRSTRKCSGLLFFKLALG